MVCHPAQGQRAWWGEEGVGEVKPSELMHTECDKDSAACLGSLSEVS